jgi:hypothetical protein
MSAAFYTPPGHGTSARDPLRSLPGAATKWYRLISGSRMTRVIPLTQRISIDSTRVDPPSPGERIDPSPENRSGEYVTMD